MWTFCGFVVFLSSSFYLYGVYCSSYARVTNTEKSEFSHFYHFPADSSAIRHWEDQCGGKQCTLSWFGWNFCAPRGWIQAPQGDLVKKCWGICLPMSYAGEGREIGPCKWPRCHCVSCMDWAFFIFLNNSNIFMCYFNVPNNAEYSHLYHNTKWIWMSRIVLHFTVWARVMSTNFR